MKALFMKDYGGPEVMELRDTPVPEMGVRDVLVEVRAASLNPVDFKIRNGALKQMLKVAMPAIMGQDLSGVVKDSGMRAWNFKTGDRVFSRVNTYRFGTFAEFIAVEKKDLAEIPDEINYEDAASLPLVGLTSWQCLVDTLKLKEGQSILIHAGAGGVGSFAIQLAKHLGAKVTTTCSAKNIEFVKELGADEAIDYTQEDFSTRKGAFDFVFDTMGGDILLKSFGVTKPGGTVVSITGLPDPEAAKAMGVGLIPRMALRFMTRDITAAAKAAGVAYRFVLMQPSEAQLRQIAELVQQGKIRPVIDSIHELDDYAAAFAKLEDGHARGKILLRVSEDPPEGAEDDPRTAPGRKKKRRKRGPGV